MSSNNNFYRSLTNITGCLANNHNLVTNIKGSTFEALPHSQAQGGSIVVVDLNEKWYYHNGSRYS